MDVLILARIASWEEEDPAVDSDNESDKRDNLQSVDVSFDERIHFEVQEDRENKNNKQH